jgi:UDP-N-acetyl-D-glucosamine dehydrogenase
MRESPSLDVIHLLENKNAIVDYHDPYVPHIHHEEWDMDSVVDLNRALKESDCVVIITNHKSYNYAEILENSKLIVDTRNALGQIGKNNPKVTKL